MSKDKYDRQTRLWGEGQVLISTASVLCFNSDSLASEILKNLVLSGIGEVTIIDDAVVSQEDLENNFFLEKESLNKPRGIEIIKNLLLLNQDVKGEALTKSPLTYIKEIGSGNCPFNIIISCNQPEEFNTILYDFAKTHNKRLILITSCGLLNMIRLYENYHANMKLRLLETPVNDNRLALPWKELIDFSLGFDLDKMDEAGHSHVPYFAILTQALQKYRKVKNDPNANPSTKDEKNEFKEIIKSMSKFQGEENFNEALSNYYLCNKDKTTLITPKIEYIFEILKNNPFDELLKQSNDIMKIFFIYCLCLKEYYEENKTFPLVGNIPDMTADTQSYIKLKKVYQAKAEEDRKKMNVKIQDKLSKLTFDNKDKIIQMINSPNTDKEVDIIDVLNKNWPQMSLFKYEITESLALNPDEFDEDYQKVNLKWFFIFKASEKFYNKYKRYPGTIQNFKEDVPLLKGFVDEILGKAKADNNNALPIDGIGEEYVFEFCRMGKGQVPPCISMIGSMASQEAIKMITYQFDTVNNMILYDGINVTLSSFKL